jgi:hypothetical protein
VLYTIVRILKILKTWVLEDRMLRKMIGPKREEVTEGWKPVQ